MAIRLSGMVSGLDTEAIVGALVSAYSFKKDKYVKAQTKLTWKQDAWKSLNTKINTLYKSVGNLRYSSAYAAKKCTVSDPTKATVIAGDNAMNGTQTLQIRKLAQAGYLTGDKLNKANPSEKYTKDSKLVDLGYDLRSTTGRIEVSAGGKTTAINVDSNTKISDVIDQLNKAGVSANFDETNQRIFVAAKDTGKENDFKMTAGNAAGLKALSSMGLLTSDYASDYAGGVEFAVSEAGVYDPDATYTQLCNKISELKEAYYNKDKKKSGPDDTETQALIDAAKATLADPENKKWIDFLNLSEDEWKSTTTTDIRKMGMSKIDTAVKLDGSFEIKSGNSFEELANAAYTDAKGFFDSSATSEGISSLLKGVKGAYSVLSNEEATEEQKEDAKESIDNLINNNPDLVNVLKSKYGVEIENSTSADLDSAKEYFSYLSAEDVEKKVSEVVGDMELAFAINSSELNIDSTQSATRVQAEDAQIVLNGAEFNSASNSVTVNGVTIQCTATTKNDNAPDGYDTITINTNNDTSGLYDTIKNFLSSYNDLINEMMSLYNADSAGDYEPLTDDEKAEMSDTQIEKWEQKIKDSVLRRDNELGSLITSMTTTMMQTFEVNGEKVNWGIFNVGTLGYMNAEKNKNYEYHIDGDPEDSITSSKTDKLKAALASDPNKVIDFMKQMTSSLYKTIGDKMASTAVSSAYTVYNDKEMASEYSDYTSLIKKWTQRVTDMEDSYYKKFASMESTLSKIQNNSSSVTSLFG